MKIKELKTKLDRLGIAPSYYSLDGSLEPDRIILYRSYSIWEVFYFSERGTRPDEKKFSSEEEACIYV
ncbi:MAG: hypothetical protein ACK5HU_02735 [Flavobacteriales bacterium]